MRNAFTALAVAVSLAGLAPAAGPPPGDRQVLDSLLAEYREYGLPLPPRGARLVRYRVQGRHGHAEGRRSLAILTRYYQNTPELLVGTSLLVETQLSVGVEVLKPEWRPRLKADVPCYDGLAFALQCHSLGWTDIAREGLKVCRQVNDGPVWLQLRQMVWRYWVGTITAKGSDFKLIARRLNALMLDNVELRGVYHRYMIASLEEAAKPRKSKPGSIEAEVDALIDEPDGSWEGEKDTPYNRIAAMGFKAVPTLIEHLDDRRMTRGMFLGFNNFRSYHYQVKHIVSDLLDQIAGEPICRPGTGAWQGYSIRKKDALKWWRKAKAVGEEQYALSKLYGEPTWAEKYDVLGQQVRVIAERYPRHLVPLYRRQLRGELNTGAISLPAFIARSSLPLRDKRILLHEGARNINPWSRHTAMTELRLVDQPLCLFLIKHSLGHFPRTATHSYPGTAEAGLSFVVYCVDHPEAWAQLRQAALRTCVGLRMELISRVMGFSDQATAQTRFRRLAFLASFLDDAAARDTNSDDKYTHDCAGREYPVLRVRDFAAVKMASELNIEAPVRPDRTDKEWAALRQQVRDAWKREQEK